MPKLSPAAAARSGLTLIVSATLTVSACSSDVSCSLRDRNNSLRIMLSEDWEPSLGAWVEADCDEQSCILESQPKAQTWMANIPDPSSFDEIRVQVLDKNKDVLSDEVMKINWQQREPEDRCDEPWAEADLVVTSR